MSFSGYCFFYRKFNPFKGLLKSLFMILSVNIILGQIENNSSSFKFPIEENEKRSPLYIKPQENEYLQRDFLKKDPIDITNPNLNKDAKINMENQEKFLNPGDYYLSKLNGKSLEGNKDPNKYKSNQYMGDYRIKGGKARIIFRDHEYPDGDRVRILHNDQVIQPNVLLVERFKGLSVSLVDGFNKIDFVALNQGESGPNTAEVRVYDESGNMTASNQWNLATGVRATYILVKE